MNGLISGWLALSAADRQLQFLPTVQWLMVFLTSMTWKLQNLWTTDASPCKVDHKPCGATASFCIPNLRQYHVIKDAPKAWRLEHTRYPGLQSLCDLRALQFSGNWYDLSVITKTATAIPCYFMICLSEGQIACLELSPSTGLRSLVSELGVNSMEAVGLFWISKSSTQLQ